MPPIKHARPLKRATLVDQLVESLCQDIFQGALSPGEQLPPIRELSAHYGVTVPTAQRAIARLEQVGLVETRQGSGMTVLDPMTCANPAALPFWLLALSSRPSAARKLVADVLELRRSLVVPLLLKLRGPARRPRLSAVRACAEDLSRPVNEPPSTPPTLHKAEVALVPQPAHAPAPAGLRDGLQQHPPPDACQHRPSRGRVRRPGNRPP